MLLQHLIVTICCAADYSKMPIHRNRTKPRKRIRTTESSSAGRCSRPSGSRPSCRPPPRSTGTTCPAAPARPGRSGSTCRDNPVGRWGRRRRRGRIGRISARPRTGPGIRIRFERYVGWTMILRMIRPAQKSYCIGSGTTRAKKVVPSPRIARSTRTWRLEMRSMWSCMPTR